MDQNYKNKYKMKWRPQDKKIDRIFFLKLEKRKQTYLINFD